MQGCTATRRDGRDRLKCPRDGSFEKVPKIFSFGNKVLGNKTSKKEKKKQVRQTELPSFHGIVP